MRVIIELNQEEQAGTAIQVIPASSPAVVTSAAPQAGSNGRAAATELQAMPSLAIDEEVMDAGPPSAALLRAVEEGIPLLAPAGFAETNGYAAHNGATG